MNLPNSFATKRLKKKFQWNPYSILSTGYPVMNTATSRPNAINNIGAIFKIIFGRFIERPCIEFPILFHKVRSAWEKIGLGWKSSCVFRISGSKCIRCNEGANTSVHCTCTKGFWLANRRRGHLEINCKNTNLKWTVRDFVAEKGLLTYRKEENIYSENWNQIVVFRFRLSILSFHSFRFHFFRFEILLIH